MERDECNRLHRDDDYETCGALIICVPCLWLSMIVAGLTPRDWISRIGLLGVLMFGTCVIRLVSRAR